MHFTWHVWKSARRRILSSSGMLGVFRTFQDINEKVTSRFWLYGCVLQGDIWALDNYFTSGDYLWSFFLLVCEHACFSVASL